MTHVPREQRVLVGRSYTRSRRFPMMVGRIPGRDGGYLPGGPYTLTQAVIFLIGLVVVWKVPLFAWLGVGRWLLPLAVMLAVRKARIESRSPLGWLTGLANHLATNPHGRTAGHSYRPASPRRVRGQLYLHHRPSLAPPVQVAVAAAVVSPLQQMLTRGTSSDLEKVA